MTRIKGQLTTADYLPYEEYLRLLQCLRENKQYIWELYAVLGFCTAFRCSDILQLTWEKVLTHDFFSKIEKKTKKGRMVKLNVSIETRLIELYGLLDTPDIASIAILNKRTGKPYRINRVNQKVKEFKFNYKLNIRAFSTHTFRKTFGRYFYEYSGRTEESIILLQEYFNHENPTTTRRYIGLYQDDIHKVIESIKI